MTDFVAYYRVSTERQGQSGLGLDAQRAAIVRYASDHGRIVAEFTDIDSGSNDSRLQLHLALQSCRQQKATLIFSRQDRVARSVRFIVELLDSGVAFVDAENPHADRLIIQIKAAVDEEERRRISKRTKEALQAAKRRGVKLGNPNPAPAAALARTRHTANARAFRETWLPLVQRLQQEGRNLSDIARELNARQIKTARGKQWGTETVKRILTTTDSRVIIKD